MLVRQPFAVPGLTLHVHPVSGRQIGFGVPDLGARVLIEGLGGPMRRDADLVGSVLGVTLAEDWVAVLQAEGRTVPDVAVLCGRPQTTLRTHPRRIRPRLGASRRADLLHLVLSVPERAGFVHRP